MQRERPEGLVTQQTLDGPCRLKINIGIRGAAQLLLFCFVSCRLSAVNSTAVREIFAREAANGSTT